MNKKLVFAIVLASLGLTGCVAVPYDGYYRGYGAGPVVVQPAVGFSYYGGYRGGNGHRGHGHRY